MKGPMNGPPMPKTTAKDVIAEIILGGMLFLVVVRAIGFEWALLLFTSARLLLLFVDPATGRFSWHGDLTSRVSRKRGSS
mgnify:CR=1 FL=1